MLATYAPAGQFEAYGPQIIVRESGVQSVTTQFSVLNPSTTYTLRLKNGSMVDEQYEPVANTTVTLNGVVVVAPNEFTQTTGQVDKPVQLQANNEIVIQLRGRVGGAMSVEVIGDDNDLPVITASATPSANAAGWNNTNVTVTFTCTDATSGVASCDSPVTVSTEGANQIITGTAVDKAGNTAKASVTLNLDKTAPTITASVTPAPDANGFVPVGASVSFTCSDSVSGIAICPGTFQLQQPGLDQIVSGTAFDVAGNSATSDVHVNVIEPVPVITSLTPSSGGVGTLITILGSNFGDQQGSTQVLFGTIPAIVTSWGATEIQAQVPVGATAGLVTVQIGTQSSNGVMFTTPPPSIVRITPSPALPGQTAVIEGNYFGADQGASLITSLAGFSYSVVSWSNSSITVILPCNASTDLLSIQAGGQSSTGQFLIVQPELFISPTSINLLTGQEQQVQAVSSSGILVTGASWSVEDQVIASFDTTTQTVKALTAGKTNVSAALNGTCANLDISVYDSAAGLPQGKPKWIAPNLAGGFISEIFHAVHLDDSGPDIYLQETTFDLKNYIRAFTADGQLKWSWPDPANFQFPLIASADGFGGVLAFADAGGGQYYLEDLDQNGVERWRFSTQLYGEEFAVAPNGTVYLIEEDHAATQKYVVAIDGLSGAEVGRFFIPNSETGTRDLLDVFDDQGRFLKRKCSSGASTVHLVTSGTGRLAIDLDGNVILPFTSGRTIFDAEPCTEGDTFDDHDQATLDKSTLDYEQDLQLLMITPDHSVSFQTVASFAYFGQGWTHPVENVSVVGGTSPAPNGMSLFTGQYSIVPLFGRLPAVLQETRLFAVGQGGSLAYTLTLSSSALGQRNDIVLGEGNTAYTTRGGTIFRFDASTGAEISRFQASGGHADLLAATREGDLFFTDGLGELVSLDPLNKPTPWFNNVFVEGAAYFPEGDWQLIAFGSAEGFDGGPKLHEAVSQRPHAKGSTSGEKSPSLPKAVTFAPSVLSYTPGSLYFGPNKIFEKYLDGSIKSIAINPMKPPAQKLQIDSNPVVIQKIYNRETATVEAFRYQVVRDVDLIGFVGHSTTEHFDDKNKEFSKGILFFYPNDGPLNKAYFYPDDPFGPGFFLQEEPTDEGSGITSPNVLMPLEKFSGANIGLSDLWAYRNHPVTYAFPEKLWVTNPVLTQAKVLFFGACALNPTFRLPNEVPPFLQMWDIHDPNLDGIEEVRQRAIIVPTNVSTNIETAAEAWRIIIDHLTKGETVAQAIASANQYSEHVATIAARVTFQVFGNKQVTIRPR
jgi:hypothetical protein